MDPRTKKEFVADFDYEFEEKHKTVSITEQGVAKAERFMGIDHLYRAENGHLVNHLIQSLRAESLYKRDVDYAVIDGEVKIIDEFTGRILEGRRWSEGLHQAVEAKEGVRVQEENQTLATITLQNYFRMYDKLAGMTGTALTEATEFMKIYELPVVQVPTNQPMVRSDRNDQVYKTKDGKWIAVVREIEARHDDGPAGAGGDDRGRGLRAALRAADQARHQARGAQRQARVRRARGRDRRRGRRPGRGHDRHQHGRPRRGHQARAATPSTWPPSRWPSSGCSPASPTSTSTSPRCCRRSRSASRPSAQQVMEAGGLFILGTERHESRRIDNQLRGRAGRQGDPGESRFFLSAQDDLVRLFAGERIYKILDRLGSVDDEGNEEPIEAGMLSKQIEKAQRKVEEQHFLQRKHTLEYDDVLNQQREVVYAYRDEVLEGRDMSTAAREEIVNLIDRIVDEYTAGEFVEDWDLDGLMRRIEEIFIPSDEFEPPEPGRATARISSPASRRRRWPSTTVREEEFGEELMREVERYLLLEIIDQRWQEHLYDMDYLQHGIGLRGLAQMDPLVAYKNEAYELFQDLMNSVWSDFARLIYHVQVTIQDANGNPVAPEQPAARRSGSSSSSSATGGGRVTYSGGNSEAGAMAMAAAAGGAGEAEYAEEGPPEPVQQRVVDEAQQIGRNDPCWCGSGKKYKKCHGA